MSSCGRLGWKNNMELIALWTAFVLSTTDGDTFRARVSLWPDLTMETSIRIAGIDTPELRGKCPQEKKLATEAREALTALLKGHTVFLSHVEPDKYGGRFVGVVHTADGVDVARELLKRGLAATYSGAGSKHNWCAK